MCPGKNVWRRVVCLGFRFLKELAAETLSAQIFPDPHQVDIQPIPISRADHPAYDLAFRCLEDEAKVLSLIISGLPRVEI